MPSYSIVGGLPAEVLKMRFSKDIIDELEKIKWWHWSDNKIQANKAFFNLNLNEIEVTELKATLK